MRLQPKVMCAAKRLLSRSLTFITAEAKNQVNTEFQRGQRLYKSFGKGKEAIQRVPLCRRKADSPFVKIKDGFLWIQNSAHMKRNWKLRYVMLLEEKLCYMKELRDKNPQSAEWKVIKIADIVSVKISSEHISDSDTFCVKTSHSKILFRCSNPDDRDKWMTALLTAKSFSIMNER